MKFSLISDMHVDFPQEKTPYDKPENTVVVAGDTGNGLVGLKFLQKMRNKGFEVFACDGNHEHYSNIFSGRDVEETSARFREEYPSVNQLSDGTPIILRNGWYQVSDQTAWQHWMNDSFRCNVEAKEMNIRAFREAEFIRQELQRWREFQYEGVVVTHTAPCMDTLNPEFEGSFSNEWYWNPAMEELLKEFSDQIKVWCHGHTHAKNEAVVHGVRVICNPRGYPGENPDWEPMTVELFNE